MKKYRTPIILFAVFEIIAVSLWLTTGSLFYMLNFSYIGTIIGVGLALSRAGWNYAREFIHCGKCLKVCPMEVEVNNDSRKRKNATECILCHRCTKECPVKALK